MMVNASELLTAAMNILPADTRSPVEGSSIFKIQRQRKAKRRDVEERIAGALNEMKAYMRRQGILRGADVL